MLTFIVRRLLLAVPVLLGVVFVVMLTVDLLPGDAVTLMLGEHATQDAVAKLRDHLGLDKPFLVRWLSKPLVAALVGNGNNGGDTLGALRHLAGWGAQVDVSANRHRLALTRFANSEIHQNVAETNVNVNLRFVAGRRIGVASSGRIDDDERKAAMVSNLMTVLCAESEVQPVINTGTLYNG